ncbi:YhgE/Pip domain-containing protein [Corynebacterium accolens]|uniref:YhgE/Pip domain-containing protein n=1 Tax=Corynebacterium accolens TaxID=38284 RepID=UPI001ED9EF7B|nr:YhgE/Pip domain-containing protein [Corynebacterium accolens]MDK4330968.1 YhgE/Pip domain-containing protein [Corynebacterium accolens]MDK8471731.1 YhgE/Pip domain-containing protein [Corynebacterium accolens]MDK8617751.1 YhgE/Pip domain-containing protein [Corynebacterium accolens]
MNNILTILRDDLKAIRGNVMTAVIIFGLAIIPLLFTTFNVLASWDPFANTKQLKIAVASEDEGHQSDLASLKLNLGDEVLSQLSRNDEINWVLTNSDDAIEGTKSGEYYAGIVLPKDFSANLLTFYVEGTEPSKLNLYTNEKKNALSTTITQRSATGVIEKIDESFTRVVSNVGLGVISSLDQYLDEGETQAALNNVHHRVNTVQSRLDAASGTVMALSNLVDSTIPLTRAANNILNEAGNQASSTTNDNGESPIDILKSTLDESTGSLDASLAATTQSYEALSSQIEELLNNASATSAQTAQTFRTAADRVGQQTAAFQGVKDSIQKEADKVNLPAPVAAGYKAVMGQLDASIAQSNALHDSLTSTANNIDNGGKSQESKQQTQAAIASAKQAVQNARNSYNSNLKPQLAALGDSVGTVANDIDAVKRDIAGVRNTISNDNDALVRARDMTAGLSGTLQQQAARFGELSQKIDEIRDGGDLSQLADLIGDDPELLASRIASPVNVDRQPIYEVAAFGVGMTPFYLTLSLWVGALLACVLVHTNAERKYLKKNENLDKKDHFTRNQVFLGRFITFGLIGIAQSTLVVLSLIFFVEIEPEHPFMMLFASWIITLVFMLIIYSLVITFDSAGKALAVLLLVIQVSGSGGAYPLPLLPEWFQNVSPWLPATYGIDAFRSAIAGIYEADILRELGMLLLFAIPALILGLFLRPAMDNYHKRLQKAIKKTKVMA